MRFQSLGTRLMAGLFCCAVSLAQADEYFDRLERQREQADRDRVNYAWLYESRSDYYSAIAYSPKTGKYGYSYSYSTLNGARRAALNNCREADAKIVVWSKNSYCALAVGKDGYGTGYGNSAAQARTEALRECAQHTTGEHVVKCVFSGRD
jgi:hypothetical protein